MRIPLNMRNLLAFIVVAAWPYGSACSKDGPEPVIGASQGIEPGPEPAPAIQPVDAGTDAPDGEIEEDEEADADDDDPPPDISLLHANTRADAPPLGLTLDVSEKGPGLPWAVAIVNEGNEPVTLVADSRLLWFEVSVPGKRRQKVTCRLPEAIFPNSVDDRLSLILDPGEGVVEAFDARLYCFASSGQRALVPGAMVTPYFGWPEKAKVQWQRGHKKKTPLAKQNAPYVASLALSDDDSDEPSDREARKSDAGTKAKTDVEKDLKLIEGQPFALRSEYKEWSSTRLKEDDKLRREPGPLALTLTQGADARSERDATITVRLNNQSDRKQQVYFRRELVSFEVVGPDGVVTCDPQPDNRAPDPQVFSTLQRKKGAITAASRLIELCPQDTFARPGLYLVHARFDASEDGSGFGLNAFMGRVVSPTPATVRIRTGELPFLHKEQMRRVPIQRADGGLAGKAP